MQRAHHSASVTRWCDSRQIIQFSVYFGLGQSAAGTGFQIGFPMGRDSTTFRDKGTEVPSLSYDKGTTGQAKNLAKGQDGPG